MAERVLTAVLGFVVAATAGCGGQSDSTPAPGGDGSVADGEGGAQAPVCAPGSTQVCDCPAGAQGVQACTDDGSGFAVCDCPAAGDGDPGPVCEAGATRSCVCPGGVEGAQACGDDGSAWGGCGCPDPDDGPAPVCEAGASRSCACPGAADGAQACRENGSGWELCDCPVPDDGGGQDPVCEAGAGQSCPCAGGDEGAQECADDGSRWGACDCPERQCAAGASQACACAGDQDGAQACRPDGSGWEACVCEPLPAYTVDEACRRMWRTLCHAASACDAVIGEDIRLTDELCDQDELVQAVVEGCVSRYPAGVRDVPEADVDRCLADVGAISCERFCSGDDGSDSPVCERAFPGQGGDDDDGDLWCLEEGECLGHEDCGAEQLCDLGTCANAYGTLYTVTVTSAHVPPRDPNGASWDLGGGAPDLFVVVEHDGRLFPTNAVADSFDPVWDHPLAITIRRGVEFRVDLWDEDLGDPDWGGAWAYADGLPVDVLRLGSMFLLSEDGQTWLELTLWPSQ